MDPHELHQIDEQLATADVAALKFLCTDHLGKKRLETVKDAKDLFLRLSEQDLLRDNLFLIDLLYTIRRYDLFKILGTDTSTVRRLLENKPSGLSLYRKMLYDVYDNTTDENLNAIKFLLSSLPKAKLTSATFLDVLAEMEKMEMLGEDKLDKLEEVLSKCSKELAYKVQRFKNTSENRLPVSISIQDQEESVLSVPPLSEEENSLPGQSQGESMQDMMQNISIAAISLPLSGLISGSESVSADSDGRVDSEASPETERDVDELYPMTQRPLGHCLIINNHKFHESAKLGDRNGTDADKDALTEVFRRLHFQVEERRDRSSVEMREAVKAFSSKDHSKMDAFVCCILSHGEKGTVFGVDGLPVPIRDLTQPFSHCMTLTGKPKLFFIQACQGNELQRGVLSQDGPKDDECEEDAVKAFGHSVPIEADFLIGMATVESYKSFRHTINGSVFIQELCKQLSEGCREKKDILTIMTRVNRSVSAQDLKCHKQMPEPRYTLTKKLVLPLD